MAPTRHQATASLLNTKVALNLTMADTIMAPSVQLGNDRIIITSAKLKKRILQEYERDFGNNIPHSIVTRKKVSTQMICLTNLLFV
jgi:hypothetical protein